MEYQSVLVKYAEIGLKGKNRYKFEDALVHNIRKSLAHVKGLNVNVYKEQERIYIDSDTSFGDNYDEVIDRLKKVFGIFHICPICKIDYVNDYEKLSDNVINFISDVYGNDPNFTFKVKTRRVNKNFNMHSDSVSAELGHDILEKFKNTKVNVHNPDVTIYIEIRNHINIYSEKIKGSGGLPVGTAGKSMLLLSGGIDSPVAGYMIAKRGAVIEAIYFNAPPYTSDRAKQKVIDLAKIVSRYAGTIRLHIINFTAIQLAIYEYCPHDELTIIMRRYMMKIAEIIAIEVGAISLITGESIGQVASQTCESLYATNEVVKMPVFRPLIGFDKEEIIEIAKKIGTFETSILPYEDCCTIFVAKHPVTKPILNHIYKSEKKLFEANLYKNGDTAAAKNVPDDLIDDKNFLSIDDLVKKCIDEREEILC